MVPLWYVILSLLSTLFSKYIGWALSYISEVMGPRVTGLVLGHWMSRLQSLQMAEEENMDHQALWS